MTTPTNLARGKNHDPANRSARGTKAAKKSPWSKGPALRTHNAVQTFQRNQRTK